MSARGRLTIRKLDWWLVTRVFALPDLLPATSTRKLRYIAGGILSPESPRLTSRHLDRSSSAVLYNFPKRAESGRGPNILTLTVEIRQPRPPRQEPILPSRRPVFCWGATTLALTRSTHQETQQSSALFRAAGPTDPAAKEGYANCDAMTAQLVTDAAGDYAAGPMRCITPAWRRAGRERAEAALCSS
jgi:hypothetical protein